MSTTVSWPSHQHNIDLICGDILCLQEKGWRSNGNSKPTFPYNITDNNLSATYELNNVDGL